MTVTELHKHLEELIAQGKGDYDMHCEGGSVPLGWFEDSVDDEKKRVVL